jgi:hypothetical protein
MHKNNFRFYLSPPHQTLPLWGVAWEIEDEEEEEEEKKFLKELVTSDISGFVGLEDAFWPLVPKFAGSNPAEAVGFFRAKKSPARLPSERK